MRQTLNQLLKTLNVQQGRFKQPKLFNLMKMKFFLQKIARRFRSLTYLRCGFTCRREPPARSLSRAILSREVDEERVTCEFKKTITVMLQLSVTRVFGLPWSIKKGPVGVEDYTREGQEQQVRSALCWTLVPLGFTLVYTELWLDQLIITSGKSSQSRS